MRKFLLVFLMVAIFGLIASFSVIAQSDYPYTWIPAPDSEYVEGTHRYVFNTPEEYGEITGKEIKDYKQAPLLKKEVESGNLPPLEERLPKNPLVVNPLEKSGEYGGIVNVGSTTPGFPADGFHLNNAEAPLRPNVPFKLGGTRPRPNVPNVVKEWELSEDYKSVTLHLREGIKWSDGAPFTAEDIMFWYEDVLLNKEYTPAVDSRWKIGGEVWDIEQVDKYTLKINFATSHPTILYNLATWGPEAMTQYPKHYLKQFHPDYTSSEELNKILEEEGFDEWYILFEEKSLNHWGGTSHVPTLSPYRLVQKTQSRIVLERNPYYWKVDTEGKQLPYFDKITCKIVSDKEMLSSMTISGRFDFAWGLSTANYTAFKQNAEKGGYRVLLYPYANRAGGDCISINQTYEDPVLRKIFRDKRFRQAISLAIDRNKMNQVLFHGQGRPMPSMVLPVSQFYKKEFDYPHAYTEYNVEQANKLLNEMGLEWDKNHNYRLRPDGKKLSLILLTTDAIHEGYDNVQTAEMVKEFWQDIGVEINIKAVSDQLFESRVLGNQHQLSIGGGATTTDDNLFMAPHHYVLWHQWADATYGPLWVTWYLTDGERGEKPPQDLLDMTHKFEELLTTSDKEKIIELGHDIFSWNAENVLTIGLVGMIPGPEVVSKNMRNVPETGLDGGVAGTALIDYYYPEQFYYQHPLQKDQKLE